MKGFGRSMNETVTLPRNDAGSNGNKTNAYFILSSYVAWKYKPPAFHHRFYPSEERCLFRPQSRLSPLAGGALARGISDSGDT